jgi:hypothetical protein
MARAANMKLVPLLVAVVLTSGCSDKRSAQTLEPHIANLEERTASDRAEIEVLKQTIADLEGKVSSLQSSVEDSRTEYQTIFLDTGSLKKYARLDTSDSTASFLVSLQDVRQYLDGYKLVLHIGNTSAAGYHGFTLKARWGQRFADARKAQGKLSYDAWQKMLKEKEVSFTEMLEPASWNNVELILTPAKPESLTYLALSMTTDTVGLRAR